MAGEVLGEIWAVSGGPVVELRVFVRGVTGFRYRVDATPRRIVTEGVPVSALVIQNVDAANDVEIGNDRGLLYGQGIKIPGNATLANGTVSAGASSGLAVFAGVKARSLLNQAIPSGAFTVIAFEAADLWDTNNFHDPAVNNTRLTCAIAGKYLIVGHLAFANNAAGTARSALIRLNGVTDIANDQKAQVANAAFRSSVHCPTVIYDLVVGDYVELFGFQDTGAPLNANADFATGNIFEMARIQ